MLNCPAPPLQTTNVNTVLSYSLMVDGDLFLDSAREGDDLQLSSKPDPEGFVLVTRTVLVDPSSPATIIIGVSSELEGLVPEVCIIKSGD